MPNTISYYRDMIVNNFMSKYAFKFFGVENIINVIHKMALVQIERNLSLTAKVTCLSAKERGDCHLYMIVTLRFGFRLFHF